MAITLGRWDLLTDALFFLFQQLGAINLSDFYYSPSTDNLLIDVTVLYPNLQSAFKILRTAEKYSSRRTNLQSLDRT